jgi:transcriptional regulator with XRE-family HTH domain
MTQGERMKELRKTLSLTLEKFGQRIGVGKSTISDLENGRRSLSEHMTKSICREFSVDYMWLTTGEGEMFVESDDDFFERIDRIMAGENESRKNMIKTLLYASDADIEAFDRLVDYYISLRADNKKD